MSTKHEEIELISAEDVQREQALRSDAAAITVGRFFLGLINDLQVQAGEIAVLSDRLGRKI